MDANIVAIGGKNIAPVNSRAFVKAIGIALDSFIGCFSGAQGTQFIYKTYVSSVATCNALYEKKVLKEVNCFDETLKSEAEDAGTWYE